MSTNLRFLPHVTKGEKRNHHVIKEDLSHDGASTVTRPSSHRHVTKDRLSHDAQLLPFQPMKIAEQWSYTHIAAKILTRARR